MATAPSKTAAALPAKQLARIREQLKECAASLGGEFTGFERQRTPTNGGNKFLAFWFHNFS